MFLLVVGAAAQQPPAPPPAAPLPNAPSSVTSGSAIRPQECAASAAADCPRDSEPTREPAAPEKMPTTAGELGHNMEQAVKTQPPCRPDVMPCRLSGADKFHLFAKRTYSPYTFVSAALDTGYSHLTGENYYGKGARGYFYRYGVNLGDGEARSFFQTFLFSTLLHQDPRYHRVKNGNVLYRAAYASSRVIVGRTDDGRCAANWPQIFGTGATTALGNIYHPDEETTISHNVNRAIGAFWSDAASNVLREFWPDMKGWFVRHEPEKMKRIEQKIDDTAAPRPAPTPPR
jgi:hypothetical protein